METIVDRIRALCLKNHTSITKIESELGFANGTIGKWAKGKRKPPLEKVMAIAKRLNTTEDYLYYGEKETPSTPEDEGLDTLDMEALNLFRQLWPDNRKHLLEIAQSLLKAQEVTGGQNQSNS